MTAAAVGLAIMLMWGLGIELRAHYRQFGLGHAIAGTLAVIAYLTFAFLLGE